MSRAIKFRAWDKDQRRMVNLGSQGRLVYDGESAKLCFGDDFHDDFIEASTRNIELMQFTGLLDRNGREIYEGDIVRAATYQLPNGQQRVDVLRVEYRGSVLHPFHEIIPDNDYWMDAFSAYEVIGNIYENPDLLEQSKR